MLFAEWNQEDALAVHYAEGLEKGMERGLEKGREEGREEIALNALEKGIPIELIHSITGLDLDTIRSLGAHN